jgi:hypothetical protein
VIGMQLLQPARLELELLSTVPVQYATCSVCTTMSTFKDKREGLQSASSTRQAGVDEGNVPYTP